MTDKGIGLPMPWPQSRDFGGKGVLGPDSVENPKKKKKKPKVQPKEKEKEENEDEPHDLPDIPFDTPQSQEKNPLVIILRDKKKT